MDLQLKNRTCVVTGASRGIGRGIAKVLAGEGCRVAIVARRKNLLEELADEIAAAGHTRPIVVAEDLIRARAVTFVAVNVVTVTTPPEATAGPMWMTRAVFWRSHTGYPRSAASRRSASC